MKNLDWNKIKNWQDFQRLINHLFTLECNSPGFIPSDPYIGADGDWDGFYDNFYPPEKTSGKYSIQSKHTNKTGKVALSHLKKEIKEELVKAKNNNVDHLRIATNAKLRVDQVVDQIRELKKLKDRNVKTLEIWHRENLSIRIEQQPFLRHYFFGDPQFPALVPWNLYFEKFEQSLIDLGTKELIKFESELVYLRDFILQEKANICILYAPGGYGKSHLLREIARRAHLIDQERQCWLVRPGFRDMRDALQEEIISGRKYLLILDDADRYPEEMSVLSAFAKGQGDNIKVVFTARTTGIELINRRLRELKCENIIVKHSISKWQDNDLTKLLRLIVGKEKLDNEEFIIKQYSNPFILVWFGRQIRGKALLNLDKLKETIKNSIEAGAEKVLADIDISKYMIDELLLNLACVVPFNLRNSTILETFEKFMKMDSEEIEKCIQKIINTGILRVVGKSVRFNPDMIGDLYLAFKLESYGDKGVQDLFERWLGVCPEKIINNLSSATAYTDLDGVKTILKRLIQTRVSDAVNTPNEIRQERLKLTAIIADIIPTESMDLIYAYLKSKAPPSDDPIVKKFNVDFSLSLDNFGPVVDKLIKYSNHPKEIVAVIRDLAISGIKGSYDNYKPKTLIREVISPMYHNTSFIKEALRELNTWLNTLDIEIFVGELICEAISEILAGSHYFTRSYGGKFEFGERFLPHTQEINELRDIAMSISKSLLFYPKTDLQLLSIDLLENIGMTRMQRLPEDRLPLSKRIASDRTDIIDELERLIEPHTSFLLLNRIESLLIRWWAQYTPGTNRAADLLRSFPRPAEYIIFRYYVGHDNVIRDFEVIERAAPTTNRWEWFIAEFMHQGWSLKPKDLNDVTEKLNASYKSPSKVVDYLISLNNILNICNPVNNPPFILCWVQRNINIFKSIRENANLWYKIPDRFKNEIDLAISKLDNKHVEVLASEILNNLPNVPIEKVTMFLRLLEEGTIPLDLANKWLNKLTKKGTSETRCVVILNLYYIFGKTKDTWTIIKLMNAAVKHENTLSYAMIRAIYATLHWIYHAKLPIPENKNTQEFRTTIMQLIKDVPHIDSNVQTIIGFSCSNVAILFDFINYRLDKYVKMINKDGLDLDEKYEAIPYEGLKCLPKFVRNYNEYKMILNCVVDWYKRNPLLCYSLEHLISPIIHLKQNSLKETYLEKVIQERINDGNIEEVLITAGFLEFSRVTMPILLKILQEAFKTSLETSAKRMFSSVVNSGTWTSTPGKPPPALENKKVILSEMYDKCPPGSLRNFIRQMIDSIEAEIQSLLQDDEEFLNPKI